MPRLPSDDPSDLGLPPPPGRPAWVELKDRLPLDGRVLAWVAAALVALGAAVWLLRPAPPAVEEALPMASTTTASATASAASSSTTASLPAALVVHAAGAVVRPGIYTLDPTARVDDLVRAAGGLAPDADGARINLAAPLADGARVYVPAIGETDAPAVVGPDVGGPTPGGAPDSAGAGTDAPAAPVDLNTATEAELDELPGVGPAIAAAIVAFRTENGGFASVDDLLDVRGIGEAKLAELRPLVTT